jgi:hypothetical protein
MVPIVVAVLIATNIVTFVAMLSGDGHGILHVGELKSFDIASIALMAATLVVAGVGVAVALVTFVGYAEIRRSSIEAAEKAATKAAADVAEAVATRIARETPATETDADEAAAIANAAADGEAE